MSYSETLRFKPTMLATLLAGGLHAATLGELQAGSWLGQALSAKVRINAAPEELLSKDCFGIALHEGESDGVLRTTAIDFAADKGGGWLHIYSDGAINEPIAQLTVKIRCHGSAELRREYTLFLDPPAQAPRAERAMPAPAANPPLPTVRLATPPPATVDTRAPTRVVPDVPPTIQAATSSDHVATQAESFSSIARQRYPAKPDSAKLYAAQLARLNPANGSDANAILPTGTHLKMPPALKLPEHPLGEVKGNWTVQTGESFFAIVRKIYPDQPARKKVLVALMRKLNPDLPRDGEKPLPVGMSLQMPSRLDAKIDELGKPAPTTTKSPATPTQAATTAKPAVDRLIVSSGKPLGPANTEAEQLQQREGELTDQLSEQTARMNEAQYRIDKLEKRLTWLTEQLAKREQAEQAARAEKAAVAKTAQRNQWLGLVMAGAAGALLASLLAVLLGRVSRRRSESSQEAERLAQSLQPDSESMLWQDLQEEPAPPPVSKAASNPAVPFERPQSSPSAADMDVFYLNNIASEAALLAAHGQYDHAINMLKDEIDARPTQIVNWMQLLELYHGHRDAAAFIELAQRFRSHFASQALWAKVVRMGVELAPHESLFRPGSRPISVPPSVRPDNVDDELTAVLDSLPGPAAPSPALQPDHEANTIADQTAAPPDEPPAAYPLPTETLAEPPAPKAQLEPLMFELDLPSEKGHAFGQQLIDVPGDAANSPTMDPLPTLAPHDAPRPQVTPQGLAHAEALIAAGDRETGAELLEQLMLTGSLEERIAAAELLVKLTSPDDDLDQHRSH